MRSSDIPDKKIQAWWSKQRNSTSTSIMPSILQLEVTKNCNLKCVFCHKGQNSKFDRSDISDIVIKQVSPIFPYLKLAMLFGDGEPLLYKGFWDIVSQIREASPECAIDFITNGTTLTRKNVDLCLQHNISHIGVSLAGATPEVHNSLRMGSDLNQIKDNLMYLKESKAATCSREPYVDACYTVMQSNYVELPQFIELCQDMGCHSVGLQTLIVIHPSLEDEVVSDQEL